MGGNVRHADKGPDKRSSECSDCNKEFSHRKFSHPKYCPECREERQKAAELNTDITIDNVGDGFSVTVFIRNPNDVDMKVPTRSVGQSPAGALGYIKVVGDEFECKNVIIGLFRYGHTNIRSNSTRSYQFTWKNNNLQQSNKPSVKFKGVVGEEFRDEVSMSVGKPEDEPELAVMFNPVEEADEVLTRALDSD